MKYISYVRPILFSFPRLLITAIGEEMEGGEIVLGENFNGKTNIKLK